MIPAPKCRAWDSLNSGGPIIAARQEFTEFAVLAALIEDRPLPNPDQLGADPASYLYGLGDVIGELRRWCLDCLRQDELTTAEGLLELMDELTAILGQFDYPAAILNLRPKQDSARRLLENTRGEVTMAALRYGGPK